ncbi:molybdate ABC transporter substrate-binding protein [Agrococcus sp. SGAir0287]|uniref:molybdate ABC transporter substrate-binding protein n=1 Tax=Agrococcus sp. SGAir0287 TaxID=2070347 RepID=UPI0010CD246D|nr:molybdate ABC transporter substrate-binding protein [Agrococcus sp. SGAir0287]QCR19056.1 molybdate ABC transporter substrate-binding protein [Agrococcus sp. SGAir0287]
MSAAARPSRAPIAAAVAALTLALAGCASAQDAPTASSQATEGTALDGELTIFAAASLTTAFDELAAEFEAQHPGVDVRPIAYDGSSTLATQIVEGAPADVFASADEATMARVVEAGLATDPVAFATNTLVLVVPIGDPGDVEGLDGLADPDRTVVLCAPEVPCGAASQALLEDAGVVPSIDSAEQSVTAVLAKVAAGEADAGLVYVTDAAASADVESIEVAGAEQVVNTYPIVALDDAADPDVAAAFVAFVTSEEGRAVLAGLGFGAP